MNAQFRIMQDAAAVTDELIAFFHQGYHVFQLGDGCFRQAYDFFQACYGFFKSGSVFPLFGHMGD